VTSEPSRSPLPPRCPTCGATVRSDVSWCTQCYSPLVQEPDERPQGDARVDARRDDALTGDVGPEAQQGRSQREREGRAGPSEPVDPAEVERLAAQMLAQLAAEPDDLHAVTSRLPSTRATRALAVAAVIVVGSALVLALMFVVGSAL